MKGIDLVYRISKETLVYLSVWCKSLDPSYM